MVSKNKRFELFLNLLKGAPPAGNRDEAIMQLTTCMDEIEDKHSGIIKHSDFVNRMHVFDFNHGSWNKDKDPWYWDDNIKKKHRLEIYSNGRIVILGTASKKSLLNKNGK